MLNKNALITIDCDRKSEHTINPYLFGHFVEDIRDHMEAMLAFPLRDMDFESEAETKTPVSGSWRAYTSRRNTGYAMEAPAPRHSGRAQRIRILSDDEAYAGIAQKAALKGPMKYTVRLVARASIELQYAMVEAVDRRTEETLGQLRVELSGHNWHEYVGELSITRACSDAEIGCMFRPSIQGGSITFPPACSGSITRPSLPIDSIAMVKREVIEMTRGLNAGMMRLAGNYISAYHWEHGIGPVLERPVMYNRSLGRMDQQIFRHGRIHPLCREAQVEPLICVNDGSGTPEEARSGSNLQWERGYTHGRFTCPKRFP